MKRNNQGLSLVELLVAMAILGVLGAMFFIGLGVIPRTNARSCANELKTIIGQTRIQTMGKRETILKLSHKNTDGKYYTEISVDSGSGLAAQQEELCGKKMVNVSYHLKAGGVDDPAGDLGNFEPLAEGDDWVIVFDRSSGKELRGGSAAKNMTYDEAKNTLCDAFLVEGGGVSYLIRINTITGKVSMNRI